MPVVGHIQQTKILVSEGLNKIYQWLYQIVLSAVRKIKVHCKSKSERIIVQNYGPEFH